MQSASSISLEGEPSGLAHPCWPIFLLSAAEDPQQCPHLLGYLARSLGCTMAALVETDPAFRQPAILSIHGDQSRAAGERWFERDPVRGALEGRSMRPGEWLLTHEVLADALLDADALQRQTLSPMGCHYGFWLTLTADAGRQVHLTMSRPRASGPVQPQELTPLLIHTAALQMVVRQTLRAGQREAERAALSRVTARLPHGFLLLSGGLKVEFLNEQARRILDGRFGLEILEGRLTAAEPGRGEEVTTFLDQAAHPIRMAGQPRVLRLRTSDGRADLWLYPERLDAGRGRGRHEPATLALTLITSECGTPVRPELLEALFRLTPAEARVAALVGSGLELGEAAERCGTKALTVKGQLRQAYRKIGVNRHGELVMLLVRLTGL